jgi:nicotinamide-nucleotide amidase
MILRLIAVGDELLGGRTSDTNSTAVQRALGLPAAGIQVVGDQAAAIGAALAATEPGAVVVIYGGLGSTADDLTRDAIAAWAGVPLDTDDVLAGELAERARQRGFTMCAASFKQAEVPRGLVPVRNPVGSAPALVGPLAGRWLVVLPGVPVELHGLLPLVRAELESAGLLSPPPPSRLWRVAQMAEMPVARLCEPVRARHLDLGWSWWLVEWGIDVQITAPQGDDADLAAPAAALDDILGERVYARRLVTLPRVVLDLLGERGETLAVAESCTGGLLGAAITGEPGSSAAFLGGVLTYADAAKRELAGVPATLLAAHGAVSREVAEAMAAGARARLGADHALAVTGIAGPDGGTATKPVGTTWVALASGDRVEAGCYRFPADRARNRALAVNAALDALRRKLAGVPAFAPERLNWTVVT